MRSCRVFLAGHQGLVGSAIARELAAAGYSTVLTEPRDKLDLRSQSSVYSFFDREKPEVVFLAAAKVGGIQANNVNRWDFLHDNIQIQTNVLGAALRNKVRKVVFFGSSCVYPKLAQQPIREEYLLTGPLEPTNEPYAVAKIAGLKMVESANRQYGFEWLSLMPTNLYGPHDNFDLMDSHVLPAMIRKFHEAKQRAASGQDGTVRLWGSGDVLREFLHVDDLARAALHLLEKNCSGVYNVGYGSDIPIRSLAGKVAEAVEYAGPMTWDATLPDGTPRKLLDSSRVRGTGWAPSISLEEGLRSTYAWYLENVAQPKQ